VSGEIKDKRQKGYRDWNINIKILSGTRAWVAGDHNETNTEKRELWGGRVT